MPEPAQILVVDDDAVTRSLLAGYLAKEGYAVSEAGSVEEARARLAGGDIDVVLLDIRLPGTDGLTLTRELRAESEIGIILVTGSKKGDVDRIVGLELGADDYVPKPCSPRELAARLKAILRRVREARDAHAAGSSIVAGPVTLWPGQRRASLRGEPLALTSTEFNVLAALARRAGRVVDKGELSQDALGRPLARFDRSLDVHVSSLRHKLGARDDGSPWIETVRGRGYQFVLD